MGDFEAAWQTIVVAVSYNLHKVKQIQTTCVRNEFLNVSNLVDKDCKSLSYVVGMIQIGN